MNTGRGRVAAVIVSYNRRKLLLEAVEAVLSQTRPVDDVIVVDNASDDGAADAVEPILGSAGTVIRLRRNVGGAGGFAVGLAAALQRSAVDAVWLMDDDTVPTPSALAELERGLSASRAVVAASRVVWHDGSDHPMNTPRRRLGRRSGDEGWVPVRSASFVSMLVAAGSVRERGLPIADYFIWNDDFEFSTRMIRGREGAYVPTSIVEHRTKRLVSTDDDPGARFYYEVRNKLWLFRLSKGLSFSEKLIYGASTLRRWLRTASRSQDRRTLLGALGRGLLDGMRSSPRANSVVLSDVGLAGPLLETIGRESRV